MTLSSGLIIGYNGSQNSGKCLTYVYQFNVKGIVDDTNEQPDEVHRASSESILSIGFSVQVESGVCHSPSIRIHSPTWKLSEPHSFRIFLEISSL